MCVKIFILEKSFNFLKLSKFNSMELLNDFFFLKKIFKKFVFKTYIVIKLGIDPNKNIIHLGHLILINKIKQFTKFKCKIILIIGNFTVLIGDPSYKMNSRKFLKQKYISLNINYFLYQLNCLINIKNINIYYNNEWISVLNINDLICLFYLITLSQLLYREDFKKRYINNLKISFNELVYPIIQAFDSVFIKSDIELGGIDQKLNFLITRDIQKKIHLTSQIIILMPILIGLDGKIKMSKSENNCLSFLKLSNFIQKFFKINSFLINDYYINFAFKKFNKFYCINNKKSRLNLIYEIFLLVLNKNLFYNKIYTINDGAKILKLKSQDFLIYKLLKFLNLIKSNNKSVNFIKQKSLNINKLMIKNFNLVLMKGRYLLKLAKTDYVYIILF